MKTIALFPGQGSQHVGMAKDLHDNFRLVRELFEEASDAVKKDLRKLCFDGPESDLVLTENTQPCLLVSSVAAYRVAVSELGYKPDALAGHSLGEYSALVAGGALPLETAVAWVRERGRAMQKAVPAGEGTMAAILSLEDHQVKSLCERASANVRAKRSAGENPEISVEAVVEPANFNSPGQVVVAGSVDAVAEAVALVKAGEMGGGKAIPLSVSAPFHCRLMKPARDRMAQLFSEFQGKPAAPVAPYIPNRTGRLTQESGVVFELLVEQVDNPVLWKQSMEAALNADLTTALEFGPGKVLAGLMKRIAQPLGRPATMMSIGDTASVKALGEFLRSAK
jgi:[acyl-carrier-protein] S-malonyltransferase